MKKKFLYYIFSILFLGSLQSAVYCIENSKYEFGPKTDKVLVFTAPTDIQNNDTSATLQLKSLASHFRNNPPPLHVIIAITKNDITQLPEDVKAHRYAGSKKLAQQLEGYLEPIVIILNPNETERTNKVRIVAGVKGISIPSWFLKTLYSELVLNNIPIDYQSHNTVAYRLGWIKENPLLAEYFSETIPAVELKTNTDINSFLASLPEKFSKLPTTQWDKHYLSLCFKSGIVIIKEEYLVITTLCIITILLFVLIMFSFLVGKKTDLHLKDFFNVYWAPLYLLTVNFFAFLLSTNFIEYLFYLRFNTVLSVEFLPFIALTAKIIIGILFITCFIEYNKFIRLPKNIFIYGYIASICCLINFFIFSAINFSLSLLFLCAYLLAFLAYHIKKIYIQILSIGLMTALFFPYVIQAQANSAELIPLFFNKGNFFFAIGVIPLHLMFIRLISSMYIRTVLTKKKIKKRKISLQLSLISGASLIMIILIFTFPTREKHTKIKATIMHTIEDTKEKIEVTSRIPVPKEFVVKNEKKERTEKKLEDLIEINTSIKNYLERSLGMISISSKINVESITIEIIEQNSFELYEADYPFERFSSESKVEFISPLRPQMPFVIHFSGKKNMIPTVRVTIWSFDNIFSIDIPQNSAVDAQYLLKIQKTSAPTQEKNLL